MCESFSPEIFELDGDGELVLRTEEVPEGAADDVQTAVMSCPTEALSLES
jgi:ferredoxin